MTSTIGNGIEILYEDLPKTLTKEERQLRTAQLQKDWVAINIDRLKEYHQEHYQLYKDERLQASKDRYPSVRERLLEMVLCTCGKHYTFNNKKRHQNTKLHAKLIASQFVV